MVPYLLKGVGWKGVKETGDLKSAGPKERQRPRMTRIQVALQKHER